MSCASKIVMGGPKHPRSITALGSATLLAVGVSACTPPAKKPTTPTSAPPAVETSATTEATQDEPSSLPTEPSAPTSPAIESLDALKGGDVVIVDPGDPNAPPPSTLVEAARIEKERKKTAGKPVAVITNKTLPQYSKGQLTFAEPKKGSATNAKPTPAPSADPSGQVEREKFWRDRIRLARQSWRDATDEIATLQAQAEELRRRFYSENDPFIRDGDIKPAWDRALDRLRLTRERAEAGEKEVEKILEEGRVEGALPGWLREGADLEPKPRIEKAPELTPREPTPIENPPQR